MLEIYTASGFNFTLIAKYYQYALKKRMVGKAIAKLAALKDTATHKGIASRKSIIYKMSQGQNYDYSIETRTGKIY